MIYTAPCVMLLMCADPLRGQVGGDWNGNREYFGPKKLESFRAAFGRGCLQQPVLHLKWVVCFLSFFSFFGLFRNGFACFGCFDTGRNPKQTEKMLLVSRNKQKKNYRNRLSFCLFLFQPNIFLVCFKDTLTQGIQTGASLHSSLQ